MENTKTNNSLRVGKSGYSYKDGVGVCAAVYGSDGLGLVAFVMMKDNEEDNARRLVAAWNYCAGLPIETLETGYFKTDIECKGCTGPCGRCQEFKIDELKAENAALRAAVLEMQRMLLPIERLEVGLPGTFKAVCLGTGIDNLNAYRQTLEAALAKIEENK